MGKNMNFLKAIACMRRNFAGKKIFYNFKFHLRDNVILHYTLLK